MPNKKMVFMRWAAFLFILCNVLFSCSAPVRAEALPPPVSVLPPEAPQVHLWQHGQALVVTPQGAFATSNPVELGAGSVLYDKLHQNYLAGQVGSPAGGGSATNPEGFRASVNPAGQAMLTAEVPVGVTAPPGAAVAGAAAAAGVGVMAKAISLGGPLAATLAKGALIGAGAVGAVFGSPILMGALMTASVGMTGYQLYQGLKGQGITGKADGSADFSSSGYLYGAASCQNYPSVSALLACMNSISLGGVNTWAGITMYPPPSDGFFVYFTYNNGANQQNGTTGSRVVGAPVVTPATNEQMIAALLAATAAATVAADAANFALKNGQKIPPGTPMQPAAPVEVKSGFVEIKSLIDALNNNTSVQKRNIATIEQGQRYGDAPIVRLSQEERMVVNAAPGASSITQIATPPILFSPGGVVSSSTDKQTPDLCALHPEITACSDMSNPSGVVDTPLKTKDVNLNITPVSVGTGLASCPPPLTLIVPYINKTVTLDGSKWLCESARLMKPLNISLAWLGAGFIVMGGIRRG